MRDRRKDMRPPTRLQLLQIAGGLAALEAPAVEAALTALYCENPSRWQRFMDEATVLIAATHNTDSGFAPTMQPADEGVSD